MKTIYLIRHGSYDYSGSLSTHGRTEIAAAAVDIAPEVVGRDISIYHSPVPRAVESAEILAAMLGLDRIASELLRCSEFGVDIFVRDLKKDAILVSHQPDLEDFASAHGIYSGFSTGGWKRLRL